MNFPENEDPEVFGMHENANITFQMKESKLALETILSIQPRDVGIDPSGKTPDQIVEELCSAIEEKIPFFFKTENQSTLQKNSKKK